MAFIKSSRGTRTGIRAERVGWSKLNTVPEQNAISTIIQTPITPVSGIFLLNELQWLVYGYSTSNNRGICVILIIGLKLRFVKWLLLYYDWLRRVSKVCLNSPILEVFPINEWLNLVHSEDNE